jgi:hypothetical protein
MGSARPIGPAGGMQGIAEQKQPSHITRFARGDL